MKNDYKIVDDVVEMYVRRNNGDKHSFVIDVSDKSKVITDFEGTWCLSQHGKAFYVKGNYRGKYDYLHRVLMSPKEDEQVDHINNNTLDNRRSNLRIVTIKENSQNRKIHPKNKTGIRGVSWDAPRKKYVAQVMSDYKRIFLGRFKCKEEARVAVEKKRRELGFLTNKRR